MYLPRGLKHHLQRSVAVGISLGVGNTVLVFLVWGALTRQPLLLAGLALAGSLLFTALFFLATAEWDFALMFRPRPRQPRPQSVRRTHWLRHAAAALGVLFSVLRQ